MSLLIYAFISAWYVKVEFWEPALVETAVFSEETTLHSSLFDCYICPSWSALGVFCSHSDRHAVAVVLLSVFHSFCNLYLVLFPVLTRRESPLCGTRNSIHPLEKNALGLDKRKYKNSRKNS